MSSNLRLGLFAAMMLAASACAVDPLTGVAALGARAGEDTTLDFEYTVEGPRLTTSPEITYYLVLDTNGDAADGPIPNGPAPISHPAPDIRAYLPFFRTEADVLDREPVSAIDSRWTDYFALAVEGGTWTMRHGQLGPDGAISDRVRQLTPGGEWGVRDGRTVQLRVPFASLRLDKGGQRTLEANVIVSRRVADTVTVVDAWKPRRPDVQSTSPAPLGAGFYVISQSYITLPTDGLSHSETDDSPIGAPEAASGEASALNIVGYTAHVPGVNQLFSLR